MKGFRAGDERISAPMSEEHKPERVFVFPVERILLLLLLLAIVLGNKPVFLCCGILNSEKSKNFDWPFD